ncbi:MAG: preprotein translocase subunit SecE [Anaerolineaceae bacterium]|nr:preprotein translocase subunit SecE [Anaerolineaceae bacterium]
MAEKTAKVKQPENKPVQKAARPVDKDREKPKKPNMLMQWWRETIGELRKVAWPTVPDARRLTLIVLAVMFAMSAILGILDWVFSFLVSLLVS